LRLNTYLGAGGAFSKGRRHDPEEAKSVTLSFKTAVRPTGAIAKHNIKIICFAIVQTSRLRVDKDATAGGKPQMSAHDRRMILICKTNMHASSAMSPGMCTGKSDRNDRHRWLITALQKLEQHQPIAIPQQPQEEDEIIEEQHGTTEPPTEQPPSGSG
jgi:hypothetical protein